MKFNVVTTMLDDGSVSSRVCNFRSSVPSSIIDMPRILTTLRVNNAQELRYLFWDRGSWDSLLWF